MANRHTKDVLGCIGHRDVTGSLANHEHHFAFEDEPPFISGHIGIPLPSVTNDCGSLANRIG